MFVVFVLQVVWLPLVSSATGGFSVADYTPDDLPDIEDERMDATDVLQIGNMLGKKGFKKQRRF